MAKAWYYTKDGVRHGPVASAELRDLAKAGVLSPSDPVWKEGMKRAVRAGKLKGLYDQIGDPPTGQNNGGPLADHDVASGTGEKPPQDVAAVADPAHQATVERSVASPSVWVSRLGEVQIWVRGGEDHIHHRRPVRDILASSEVRTRLARCAGLGAVIGLAYSLFSGHLLYFCLMGACVSVVLEVSGVWLYLHNNRQEVIPVRVIGAILGVLLLSGIGQAFVGRVAGWNPAEASPRGRSLFGWTSATNLSVCVNTVGGSGIVRNICNPCLVKVRASVTDAALQLRFDLDAERVKQNRSLPLPLLVRVFDRQGTYLAHFYTREEYAVTEAAWNVYMQRFRQQQMLPDVVLARMKEKDRFREPSLLRAKANVLSFDISPTVAAQAGSVELGFWQAGRP